MDRREQALDFLRRHGMAVSGLDPVKDCRKFQDEMDRGLRGEGSSLMMLPAYLSLEHELPQHGRAVAMDAGGTNFRIALVDLDEGQVRLGEQTVFPMPGSRERITKEQFLDILARQLDRHPAGSRIGFCFSFPAEITPDLDGVVILFDKEVKVDGGAGMHLCRDLAVHMSGLGMTPPESGAVINDTVAALLGGYLTLDRNQYDGWIGFILGTGLNCCYSEDARRITKLADAPAASMVINMESGGYSGFPQGDYDKALDEGSDDPGCHRFEKMVSGAYLGPLTLLTLKGAAEEDLFSPACAKAVAELDSLPLYQVSAYLDEADPVGLPEQLAMNEADRAVLDALLYGLLDRAAEVVAISLTAVIVEGDMGKTAQRPAAIVTEGSTFHKFRCYRERIEAAMDRLCTNQNGRYWSFVSTGEANLYGAAAAALLK